MKNRKTGVKPATPAEREYIAVGMTPVNNSGIKLEREGVNAVGLILDFLTMAAVVAIAAMLTLIIW